MPLFDTKRIDLFENEWAEIRELSVDELKEADTKGTEEVVKLMKIMPEKIVERQLEQQREVVMERIIRYEGYDPGTLIRYGLTGWSFDEPCDTEHVAKLSARRGEIVARAVFELSVIPSGEVKGSSLSLVGGESEEDSSTPTTSTKQEEPSEPQSMVPSPTDS